MDLQCDNVPRVCLASSTTPVLSVEDAEAGLPVLQVLSDSMVLTEDDGGLCLMMRVGDTFPNQTLEPVVRAYLYRWPGSAQNPGPDYTVCGPKMQWCRRRHTCEEILRATFCCGRVLSRAESATLSSWDQGADLQSHVCTPVITRASADGPSIILCIQQTS